MSSQSEDYAPLPVGIPQLARAVSYVAHKGQVDKGGEPYWTHPYRVATILALGDDGPVAIAAGFLHDVLEDTDLDVDDLRFLGFPDAVIEAVMVLTRWTGERYEDFIERCAEHPVARVVKLADLSDNLDERRPFKASEGMRERYIKARERLAGAHSPHYKEG